MYEELESLGEEPSKHSISWKLISENKIQSLSHGEIKEAETLNYRTLKPVADGILAENIFGPIKDFECKCGKYKGVRYKGVICHRCGVAVESSNVRREWFGHIDLACNVVWPQFLKGNPSILALVLDISQPLLMQIIYGLYYVDVQHYWGTDNKNTVIIEVKDQRIPNGYEGGVDAIASLLSGLDLDYEIFDLNSAIKEEEGYLSIADRHRLEVLNSFKENNISPRDMITSKILVLPAALRPILMHEGKILGADINKKYLSIINRKKRLDKFKDIDAPDMIVRFQKRLIQQAVNNLFADGFYTDDKGDNQGFLIDYVKKETKRFVDYSGCSDVLPRSDIGIEKIALPYEVILELYKPFIVSEIMYAENANNVVAARKQIENRNPSIYGIVEDYISDKYILVENEQEQIFVGLKVEISPDKLTYLHPYTYNYMSLRVNDYETVKFFVPLSENAENEVKNILGIKQNIISSFSGKLQLKPDFATISSVVKITAIDSEIERNCAGRGEAFLLFDSNLISMNSRLRINNNTSNGFSFIEETSIGRILLNECLPQNMGRVNRSSLRNKYLLEFNCAFTEESFLELLEEIYDNFGATYYVEMLEKLHNSIRVDYYDTIQNNRQKRSEKSKVVRSTLEGYKNLFASLKFEDLESSTIRVELEFEKGSLLPFYKKFLMRKIIASDVYVDGNVELYENSIIDENALRVINSKNINTIEIYKFQIDALDIDKKGFGDRLFKSGMESLNALGKVLEKLHEINEDKNLLSVIMGREPISLSETVAERIKNHTKPNVVSRVMKSILRDDKHLYMDELVRFRENEQYYFKSYICCELLEAVEIDLDFRHIELWLSLFDRPAETKQDSFIDSLESITLEKLSERAICGGAVGVFDKSMTTRFGRLSFERKKLSETYNQHDDVYDTDVVEDYEEDFLELDDDWFEDEPYLDD